MNFKNFLICSTSLLFSIFVIIIDGIIKPFYFVKVGVKMVLFICLPLLFFLINHKHINDFKNLFKMKKKGLTKAIILALITYVVIVGGYLLTKNLFDFSNVTVSQQEMGINKDNFLLVSIYISLLNSFLEEFFFRGYSFLTLKKYSNRPFAYIFSSFSFALYHGGMLFGMFNGFLIILLFIGLFLAGSLFDYLDEANDTIYSSWFVHMFANFAINTIGFILLSIN